MLADWLAETATGIAEHLQLLENYWMGDHAPDPPHSRLALVIDVYELAYQMDFGAAAKYIDAVFAIVNWERLSC